MFLPRRRTDRTKSQRSTWLAAVAAAALTAASAGCEGSTAGSSPAAPALEVVTAAYPLAQVANLIGEGKARAIDLLPAGANPFTFQPGTSEEAEIQHAGLLILAGQAVQPGLYSVAASAKQKIDLGQVTTEPYFWLDPPAMRQAVAQIAAAMGRADPAHAGAFKAGAQALEVELDSTAIDYESTLSTCPRRTVFAADDAFAALARRYDLDYTALGTSAAIDPATLSAKAASVRSAGATAVFSETWVPAPTVDAVAAASGVKVRSLDTLLGPPPGGWPRQATYINLLESNLGRFTDALGCAGSSGSQ